MDAVLRASAIYFFLLLIFRVSGKRTLSDVTTFDFVLLLIIAETTQQGLLGNDFSVTNSFILIITLIGIDIGLSLLKGKFGFLDKLAEGVPVIVWQDGQPLVDYMKKARLDEADILEAARRMHGLERLDQIKYAVLERHGGITIIPKESS